MRLIPNVACALKIASQPSNVQIPKAERIGGMSGLKFGFAKVLVGLGGSFAGLIPDQRRGAASENCRRNTEEKGFEFHAHNVCTRPPFQSIRKSPALWLASGGGGRHICEAQASRGHGFSSGPELAGFDGACDAGFEFVGGGFEIEMRLQVKPEFRRHAEVAPKPQGGVGGDGALAVDDFVNAARRHADVFGQAVLRDAHWLEEFFVQDFAGRDVGQQFAFHSQ